MKRVTKTTFKSFAKKNINDLWSIEFSSFDGMCDCVTKSECKLEKVTEFDFNKYGRVMKNVWLVGGGDDSFYEFEYNGMHGIEYYNCCGHGAILTH